MLTGPQERFTSYKAISMYTLQNFIDFVNLRIGDSSGGTVDSALIVEYANEGLRRIRRKFDIPPSTRKKLYDVFNGVYKYAPPDGFKDLVNLNYQGTLPDDLNFERTTSNDFWRAYLDHNRFSTSSNGLNQTLLVRLIRPQLTNLQIQTCDTYNTDGTWLANTTTSDASNVRTDNLDFTEGTGSVSFDITVAQSVNDYAEIYNSTFSKKNLASPTVEKVGVVFTDVYLPTASITSALLRWGTDSSNYYVSTVTTQYDGTPFAIGWNTVGFDWVTATKVGTPTDSSIGYLLFRVAYPNTLTNQAGVKIDNIVCRERERLDLTYSSDYLVVDGITGTYKESFTSATDTSSYFVCAPAFTDWLGYHVLEQVFTYSIKDPDARALNQALMMECERDLISEHPSEKPPKTYAYMESDDLADYL